MWRNGLQFRVLAVGLISGLPWDSVSSGLAHPPPGNRSDESFPSMPESDPG